MLPINRMSQSPYDMFKRRIADTNGLEELSRVQHTIETNKRLNKVERINLLERFLPERRALLVRLAVTP